MASRRALSTRVPVDSPRAADDDPRVSRTHALASALVLVGYSAVAWSVGSFYPFSVFPMYARGSEHQHAARLGARTEAGELVEVTRYRAFQCDRRLDPASFHEVCGVIAYSPQYVDDELAHHVNAHATEVRDGERVAIVRHVWAFTEDGTVLPGRDCVLARCTASP